MSASLLRKPYTCLLALFALAIVVLTALPVANHFRDSHKDYEKWQEAGQITRQGGDIYEKGKGETFKFMYPPTAAVLLAPLTALGILPLIVILCLVNTASWVASVFLTVYLVTGKALRQHPLLYLVPTACTAPYVWDIYLLGQPNLLLLACMLGAFACLRQRREWAAGGLIAFAAAIKAFPVLAIGYLASVNAVRGIDEAVEPLAK